MRSIWSIWWYPLRIYKLKVIFVWQKLPPHIKEPSVKVNQLLQNEREKFIGACYPDNLAWSNPVCTAVCR